MKEFSLDTGQYSYLVSAYAIAAFCSSIMGMLYLDFLDRKKALLIAFAGFAIGSVLCGLSNTYTQLLMLRFGTGLFGGVLGAIILSIVADLYSFKERGKAMGIIMASFSAASAIGVPFGLLLTDMYNWRLPFMILGGVSGLISVLIYFYFPSLTGHFKNVDRKRKPIQTIAIIFKDQNQVNALLAGMVLVLGHFLIIPFITPYMIRNVGLSQEEIKYIFLAGGVVTIFTAPLIGRMTDRYGVMKVFIGVLACSFVPTLAITHMEPSPLFYALIFTTLFFVFGSGRFIAPNTIITAVATPENRGSFMSMKSALQQLSIAAAAYISGFVVYIEDVGEIDNYHLVGYLSLAICTIAVFLINRLKVASGN